MATEINAGRVAMVPKGEWSASTAYVRLDVVSYHGSSYVCKQDGTGQTPDTATNYWQLLSSGLDPTVDTIAAKHYDGSTLTAETSISAAGVISKTASGVTKTFNLPAESGTLSLDKMLVVNMTKTANLAYTADKTVEQIANACDDGKAVVALMVDDDEGASVLPLAQLYLDADVVQFSTTQANTVVTLQWAGDGNAFNRVDHVLQPRLVSGTNIKTVNSTSLLGSGNVDIVGKSAYQSYVDTTTDSPVKTEAEWVASLKGADGVDLGEVAIADNLTTNDATEVLSARQGYVLNGQINGFPAVTFVKSDYQVQPGLITSGMFHNEGAYGRKHAYVLIPFSQYKGRSLTLTAVSGHYSNAIAFLTTNALVSGEAAPYCNGTTTIETSTTTTVTVPQDCECLYVYAEHEGADSFPTLSLAATDPTICNVEMVNNIKEEIDDVILTTQDRKVAVPLTMHMTDNTNGYWNLSSSWYATNDRRGSEWVNVVAGEKYLVTTKIGSAAAPIAYLAQWSGDTWAGVATGFEGGTGNAVDREYIVPSGVTKIAICSYDTSEPTLKKVLTDIVPAFYDKEESDEKYATKSEIPAESKFGVKWSTTDFDDLGSRMFDAVGKTATIGIGSTDGSSDFDGIYPWSGMKRCNIKVNSNGAKVVTFEGETGFALDGSNGDVFVRIPKFKTDHYVKDGYEYIVIGEGSTHPAFVENGVELDEIFVAAFEASVESGALYSKAGVHPAINMTGAEFLAAAQERGDNYSLYDMRCVDALWRLMAVEFGCRNSNRIIGYGYADYVQADNNYTFLVVSQAATQTNTVTCGAPPDNSTAYQLQTQLAQGNVLIICDTLQTNIVARRKIVSVTAAKDESLVVEFDGEPIDVTTSMFIGNAPIYTNFCEGVTTLNSSYALSWHTGRANRPAAGGWTGMDIETINPCRYRWVENPVGNVWHFLPDVTFVDGQMYVCKDMKDYEMFKHTSPYIPTGTVLPIQKILSDKRDVNTTSQPNYWMTSMLNDIFAKGNNFGKSYDTVHDGSITSKKGYGGYYYLWDGTTCIVNGGGFDHLWRCNILTNRAWVGSTSKWYLYGARLMFKNIE